MGNLTPDLLATCLDDLDSGNVTIDECLAAHPSSELQDILAMIAAISPPRDVRLDPVAKRRQRSNLIAEISRSGRPSAKPRAQPAWNPPRPNGLLPRLFGAARVGMTTAVAFALAIVLATGGVVYAAQDSLPGDGLYPVKTASENVALVVATSDTARARVHLDLAARRLAEIQLAQREQRGTAAETAARDFARQLAQANQELSQPGASERVTTEDAESLAQQIDRLEAQLEVARAAAAPSVQTALGEGSRNLQATASLAYRRSTSTAVAPPTPGSTSIDAGQSDPTPTDPPTVVPTPADEGTIIPATPTALGPIVSSPKDEKSHDGVPTREPTKSASAPAATPIATAARPANSARNAARPTPVPPTSGNSTGQGGGGASNTSSGPPGQSASSGSTRSGSSGGSGSNSSATQPQQSGSGNPAGPSQSGGASSASGKSGSTSSSKSSSAGSGKSETTSGGKSSAESNSSSPSSSTSPHGHS